MLNITAENGESFADVPTDSYYYKAISAAKAAGIEKFIPSLDAMCKLYDVIGEETYRDGFHCSLGTARYMLACVWFMTLCGKDIEGNTFRDFDVDVTEDQVDLAQKIAKEVVLNNGYTIV